MTLRNTKTENRERNFTFTVMHRRQLTLYHSDKKQPYLYTLVTSILTSSPPFSYKAYAGCSRVREKGIVLSFFLLLSKKLYKLLICDLIIKM